jgi:hypothetical protein
MFLQISNVKRESYSVVLLNEERYKPRFTQCRTQLHKSYRKGVIFIYRVSHAFTKDLYNSVA